MPPFTSRLRTLAPARCTAGKSHLTALSDRVRKPDPGGTLHRKLRRVGVFW